MRVRIYPRAPQQQRYLTYEVPPSDRPQIVTCSQFRVQDGAALFFDAVTPAGNPNEPIPVVVYFPEPGAWITCDDAASVTTTP